MLRILSPHFVINLPRFCDAFNIRKSIVFGAKMILGFMLACFQHFKGLFHCKYLISNKLSLWWKNQVGFNRNHGKVSVKVAFLQGNLLLQNNESSKRPLFYFLEFHQLNVSDCKKLCLSFYNLCCVFWARTLKNSAKTVQISQN